MVYYRRLSLTEIRELVEVGAKRMRLYTDQDEEEVYDSFLCNWMSKSCIVHSSECQEYVEGGLPYMYSHLTNEKYIVAIQIVGQEPTDYCEAKANSLGLKAGKNFKCFDTIVSLDSDYHYFVFKYKEEKHLWENVPCTTITEIYHLIISQDIKNTRRSSLGNTLLHHVDFLGKETSGMLGTIDANPNFWEEQIADRIRVGNQLLELKNASKLEQSIEKSNVEWFSECIRRRINEFESYVLKMNDLGSKIKEVARTLIEEENETLCKKRGAECKFIADILTPGWVINSKGNLLEQYNIIRRYLTSCKNTVYSVIRSQKYKGFLRTAYWNVLSHKVLCNAKFRCSLCGRKGQLNCHHRTYEHHGLEYDYLEDLICLCSDCHNKFHTEKQ